MPNSLLIFGIDKDLENINEKTSMNDGWVVWESLFENRG